MENHEEIHLPWSDWKIIKYLGGGAYGKVYEIERTIPGIQEKAALKIISRPKEESELEADYQNGYDQESIAAKYTEILQDYIKEYKLMKELQGQSNIVSCDDFAIEENPNGIGGKIYIRMELLTPLQKVTKERLLPEEEVIRLGKDICKALILCESRNIIHRDIKPDNIMISKFGDYKLGDFGVSKVMSHTTGGTMTGTDGYIAPEVLHMEKYGKEVDIYSLGIVMYWLLNNRRMPFIGADEKLTPSKVNEASIRRYQGEKLPAPKNGSDRLKKIVLKACEYRSKDRYRTAQEMYDALNRLSRGAMSENIMTEKKLYESAETASAEEDWQESGETIGKSMYDSSNGQTAGNSWGGVSETVGVYGNNIPKGSQNAYAEENVSETIGIKNPQEKQKKTRELDDLHVTIQLTENDLGKEKKVPVEYSDGRKKIVAVKIPANIVNGNILRLKEAGNTSEGDLYLHLQIEKLDDEAEWNLAMVEKMEWTIGDKIKAGIITFGLAGLAISMFYGLNVVAIPVDGILLVLWCFLAIKGREPEIVRNWIARSKGRIDFDNYIKNNTAFAKRLYYEKCPKKTFLKYIKKLNPDAAKEISENGK